MVDKTEDAVPVAPVLEPEFDIHAWLTVTPQTPTKPVRVCLNPGMVLELNELADKVDEARSASRSMADKTVGGLQREWQALYDRYEADPNWLTVKVRGRIPGDLDAVKMAMAADGVPRMDDQVNMYLTAQLMVEPKLSPAEVKALGARIGAGQFDEIIRAWESLDTPTVTVPKSLRP